MATITTMLLFTFASLIYGIYGQTKSAYYGNWMGRASASSSFFNTATLTLTDIVLPGSHHAGMYPEAIIANDYSVSSDSYFSDVLTSYDGNSRRLNWAKRQIGSILDQLNAGSRVLDIRLEKSGGAVYVHNGLLGASLSQVRIVVFSVCAVIFCNSNVCVVIPLYAQYTLHFT